MGRRERAVGPLERAGTVDLVPVPLATIRRAVFRGQLPVALPIPLEPLARVFGAIGVAVLADAVALADHHLPFKDLPTGLRTVVVVVSGRRVRDFEIPMDPKHVEVVIDGHAFKS